MLNINSKLLRKGLVVVTLPTLFQLIFLATLAIYLLSAQQEMQRTIDSKNIVATTSSIVASLINCELLSIAYNANRIVYVEMQFLDQKSKSESATKQLLKLCEGDSSRLALATKIAESNKETLARLSDMFTEEFNKEIRVSDYVATDKRIDRVYGLFTNTFRKADELISREREIQKEIKEKQSHYHSMIRKVIILGVALNVVLTVLLAIFLTAGTTMRLKIVLDNTRRLKNREPLAPPVGGDDEIKQLDTVFHATASDLQKMDDQRKQLVELVRNELALPLNQVQFSLHNLSSGVLAELSEKASGRLSMAAQDTNRVIRLIDDLLSIEDMQGAAFDLNIAETGSNEIIQAAVSSVKDMADRMKVNLEVVDQNISFSADKDRIVQVLINFLSNAIKFSPEGEKVTITVLAEDTFFEFAVQDHGRGIPEDKQEAVFERFGQVSQEDQSEKGGTGLGLPISKTIIEQHRGTIGVVSNLGEGSTFWFRLPKE